MGRGIALSCPPRFGSPAVVFETFLSAQAVGAVIIFPNTDLQCCGGFVIRLGVALSGP